MHIKATLLVGLLGAVAGSGSGDNYLGGARDLVYDSDRELVLIAAIHGISSPPNAATTQVWTIRRFRLHTPSFQGSAHRADGMAVASLTCVRWVLSLICTTLSYIQVH